MCDFLWGLLGQSQEEDTPEHQKPLQLHEAFEWIFQRLNSIEGKIDRLNATVGREARADRKRDVTLMASIDDVIAKATEAKSVSESTNIAVREVVRLLKAGQAGDPAKFDEALALLEAIRADDAAMLTDNTPAAETP